MAKPKYMAYGGRGYDTKEQFYNAGEGLKVKHTPGPWFFSKLEKHEAFIYGADNSIVACTYGKNKLIDRQIIAVAPELLSALKEITKQAALDAEKYATNGNEPIWAFIADASNAIAKVEGR